MFFIEQIKQQFSLTLSAQNGEGSAAAIDQHYEQNQAANDNNPPSPELSVIDGGTGEQQGEPTVEALAFQELDGKLSALNEELNAIDNDSKLVGTYTNILGDFLVRVRRGDFEGLSEEDSDFQRLLKLYEHKFEELKDMRNRGQEIEHVIAHSMSQLNEAVDRGAAGEDIDDAIDKAYEEGIEEKERQEELVRLETEKDSWKGNMRAALEDIDVESEEFLEKSELYQEIVLRAKDISGREYIYQNFDTDGNEIETSRESLIREIEHLESTYRELNVVIYNETSEGESTLSEAKDEKIEEKFLELKENGTEEQKEIIGEKSFLDMTVADFQRLQLDTGVDLSVWFLRPVANTQNSFTVHFGGNNAVKDLISSIIPLHIDSIVIDGKVASRKDGTQFSYDRGSRFTVLDGSEIIYKDINSEVRDTPELLEERISAFREQMASNVNRNNFERQANNYIQSIDTVRPENEDGWFMTMFKKTMNLLAQTMGEDPIFEEVLEKEEPFHEGYSDNDIGRIQEQGMRRFIPNGNELLRDEEFMTELSDVSDRLGVQRDDLLIVMQAESRLDPTAVNSRSNATGLIQFMPSTAEGLGTSVGELRNMSAVEQLKYVEDYFAPYANRMNSVADIYRVVFYPASIGKSSDWVMGSQNGTAEKVARQNGPGITQHSRRSDGLIDNATFDRYVEAKISQFSTIVTPTSLAEYENNDVTESIRDIEALEPGFRSKVENWLSQVRAAGIDIKISETLRTQARQDYLYEQGRTRPGDIVTSTRNSNHKTGQAIDIFFDPDTHGSMYPPINGEPWTTTARLARENGIDWGQDLWGWDGAHFQDNSL